MIRRQHFNRTAQHFAAEIGDRPLDHFAAGWPVDIGIQTGHVGDEADFYRPGVRRLRGCGSGEGDGHCGHECVEFHIFSPYFLRYYGCFGVKKAVLI